MFPNISHLYKNYELPTIKTLVTAVGRQDVVYDAQLAGCVCSSEAPCD